MQILKVINSILHTTITTIYIIYIYIYAHTKTKMLTIKFIKKGINVK